MIDLDAIRARNRKRREDGHVDDAHETLCFGDAFESADDIDALLAEVESLRRIVAIDAAQRECDRKTHDGRVKAITDGIRDGLKR